MTRICMVCGAYPPTVNGVASYVSHLSQELIGRNHKVTVVTRGTWRKTAYESANGIAVHRLPCWPLYPFHLQVHGFFVNRLVRSLGYEFDIIHLHTPLIPFVHTKLPVVVTQHGTARGYLGSLDGSDPHSVVLKAFSPMYISVDRSVAKRGDEVTAVSQDCANQLRLHYGVDNAIVIYNGVDTDFFVPGDKEQREPYVLYVGLLMAVKGLLDLIWSAGSLCEDFPMLKFVLVGEGPQERQLRRLVQELGLERRVCFVGQLSHEELLPYYQGASVCILPSHYEGLPTVLLEAMSCGTPTVCTSVGGSKEVVVDGETGYLVPPKNPEILATAVSEILRNADLRKWMGGNARRRVNELYNWQTITTKVEKIYASLVQAT